MIENDKVAFIFKNLTRSRLRIFFLDWREGICGYDREL